ncbi:MAG: ATP-binding response regulator [Anaerolineae bacterium]
MLRGRHVDDAEWDELRRGLAMRTGLLLSTLLLLCLFIEMARQEDNLLLLSLTLTLSVAIAIVSLIGHPSVSAAGVAQVAMTLAAAWMARSVIGAREAEYLSLASVILAVFLLPPRLGLAVGAGAGIAAVAFIAPPGPTSAAMPLLLLFAAPFGAISTWLTRDSLRRAWGQAEQTSKLAREVRLRQEEVNRLNKALKLSNGLLKRSLGELALAQREADEARHLKEQFATTVSHELRTPLNIILGFVEVMQRYPEVYAGAVWTPGLRRDVAEIQRSARYLSELVDDILDLARLQALRMPIHREQSSIGQVIEEAVGLANRLLAGDRPVTIGCEVPAGIPMLYIDRTRIRQVLLNLLANACRFTEAGSVIVRASRDDTVVTVSVTDTGPGVPPEQLESIFEEFRQAPAPGRETVAMAGKGLGLAIARRFVQMHGGHMWVESRIGEGSTFYFNLPIQNKQVIYLNTPSAGAPLRTGGQPLVVLVDEPEGEVYLNRHLEGYAVLRAIDMVEARELVLREHPCAVIVNDYQARSSSAAVPAQHAIAEGVPAPVIQCAFPGGHRFQAGDLYDDWLVKPVDSDRLLASLKRFPGKRRILIVDDDASFARLVRRMLEAQQDGWQAEWAENGREALAALAHGQVDILLLDIALPGMSGRAVAQQVRALYADQAPTIIAVTAFQPGVEDGERQARTFAVTLSSGLAEDDTLNLIRACLTCLRPDYARASLAAGPEATEAETPA